MGVNREALIVNSRNDSILASYVSLPQTWSITGDLNFARDSQSATLLSNGQVLVAGGRGSSFTIIKQTELYDPSTGSWVDTGDLNFARRFHTATLLENGKVLVAGGIGNSGSALNTAELYDPATGIWSNTGNLNFARERHSATLLTNGKVLVAGGLGSSFTSIASAELYDPATGTWSNTGNLNFPHERHTATLLPTGKVLVAGGNGASSTPISKAELYDAMTGSWSITTDMNVARQLHTATLLTNGKVLVAGGFDIGQLNKAELYDPASATWSITGNLNVARFFHTATLLANGTVLVAGGGVGSISTAINNAELYDPVIGSWTTTGNLNFARELHTATLLPNGEVLVAGGVAGTAEPNPPTKKAELYTPLQSAASPFWTTYQHDSTHSGLSPFLGPQTNRAALLFDVGAGYGSSSPVVGPTGMIYFTKSASNSVTWTIVALHCDGSFAFESAQYIGSPVNNLTIAQDGTIYVSTRQDLLYALFPNGSVKWTKDFSPVTPDVPSGSPGTVAIGQDGTLYLSTADGYFFNDWLVALYPDGTTKWGHNYGANGALIPAVAPTGTIISSKPQDRSVVAHDLTTGEPLWETFLGADPGTISAPAIGPDGTIYVWFNRLWALSPGGHVKWSTALTNTSLGSTPTIAADGSILFATSDFSAGGAATLFSFSASGQPTWSVGLATGLGFATPQIALDVEGTAYVSFNSGSPNPSSPLIFAVGNDGSPKWSFPAKIANTIIMGSANTAYAALFDNTLGSDTWKIYSFAGSSPTPTPTPIPTSTPTPTPAPISTPTVDALQQLNPADGSVISEGETAIGNAVTFKARVTSPLNNQVKLQVELRQITEPFTGNFDGGILESSLAASGSESSVTRSALVSAQYHWRARAIDSQGNASDWKEFGVPGNTDFAVGHSNVVFLPGFEGSRLYKQGLVFENKLWVANRNADMCALRPRTDGASAENIYTRDIIDSAVGIFDIYGDFAHFMNELKMQGFMRDWKALPYDWRLDIERIARDGVAFRDGVVSLANDIEQLANSSATGKVTLVTHSNGGLLIKELMRVLVEQGKSQKVDAIIMVAPPHLGTPKAVASLLHGDYEGIFFGKVVSQSVAREAGETMIGAYNLLPSEEYFNRFTAPVIEFDPQDISPQVVKFRSIYGTQINTYGDDDNGLIGFLLGDAGLRVEPFSGACVDAPADTRQPNVLLPLLLERVRVLHSRSDLWQAPPGVKVFQVAGWGVPTLRGIKYTSEASCSFRSCELVLDHRPIDSIRGDGTVVIGSATALPVETFYFNLRTYNRGFTRDRDHSSIMGAEPILELIKSLLSGNATPSINHISRNEPVGASWIRVTLRSPVIPHAYDTLGRHTGPVPNPDVTSDFPTFERQIPNSSFESFGGGVYLTLDTADTYRIELQGAALGTFSLILEEFSEDNLVSTFSYIDIPVSQNTKGRLFLQHVAGSIRLQLDTQGDGVVDFVIEPGQRSNTLVSALVLTDIVRTLGLPRGTEQSLTSKLESAINALRREDHETATHILQALMNEVQAQRGKHISDASADGLLAIVSKLLDSL